MKRTEEFNNILNECLERLLIKGETAEQCLESYPDYAEELRPLLQTTLAAKRASYIEPRPEFKDRARYQFLAALRERETERKHHPIHWHPRWTTVVAMVLVLLLAGGGTVMAAGASLPDQPLYPVKLASEQMQLAVTPSPLSKAELYAKFADRRVREMTRMLNKNNPDAIEISTRRLDAYLVKIAEVAAAQRAANEPLTQPKMEAKGGELRFKTDRRARLKAIMLRHAVNNPARLRALLRTASPAERQALLRAIAVSESGYEKILQYLNNHRENP
ncbi:MAG: hypothetical protein HY665_07850 [Chloroflexi bacterium]|nr:hypothetical protein [Chloroflexota bacterium]